MTQENHNGSYLLHDLDQHHPKMSQKTTTDSGYTLPPKVQKVQLHHP